MDLKTAEILELVRGRSLGFYQRADMLVRVLRPDNVQEIMRQLSPEFRREFVAFAREAYMGAGDWLVVSGSPFPVSCIETLRGWLQRNATSDEETAADNTDERLAGLWRAAVAFGELVQLRELTAAPEPSGAGVLKTSWRVAGTERIVPTGTPPSPVPAIMTARVHG